MGGIFTLKDLKRFWAKISPEPNSGCWLWVGALNTKGYGQLWHNGKLRFAHRLSYQNYVGPIAEGMDMCHRCDVPVCVNPEHLWPGSTSENIIDCVVKGRANRALGEQNGKSRLTNDGVRYIREMAAQGVEYTVIAKTLSIAPSTVGQVANGKSWIGVV